MIKQTQADYLPTGANDILIALEDLPSEEKLAYGLDCNHHLILNKGRWSLISQYDLPNLVSHHVLHLGKLTHLIRYQDAGTLTEAVREAVRELLVQQDLCTRYVYELDNEELIKFVNFSVGIKLRVDTASEQLKLVFAPELVRRALAYEAVYVARALFWRIVNVWVYFTIYHPQDQLDTLVVSKSAVSKTYYRALQNTLLSVNCNNRTLLAGIYPDMANELINLFVREDLDSRTSCKGITSFFLCSLRTVAGCSYCGSEIAGHTHVSNCLGLYSCQRSGPDEYTILR